MEEQEFTQFEDIDLMDAETDAIVGGRSHATNATNAHMRFNSSPGSKSQKKDPIGTLDSTIPPTA